MVRVEDNLISIVSDLTLKEVKARPEDIQLATQVATGLDSLGQYVLHDLVQIDARTVGCIVGIERDLLQVLDQNGTRRDLRPIEVQPRRTKRAGQTLDVLQNDIKTGSIAKVIDGPCKGRDGGKVLHVNRNFVFIHERTRIENNGVYVCRARHLKVAGGAGSAKEAQTKSYVVQSPRIHDSASDKAAGAPIGGQRHGGRQAKSELIHQTVRIISGMHKGYIGYVCASLLPWLLFVRVPYGCADVYRKEGQLLTQRLLLSRIELQHCQRRHRDHGKS